DRAPDGGVQRCRTRAVSPPQPRHASRRRARRGGRAARRLDRALRWKRVRAQGTRDGDRSVRGALRSREPPPGRRQGRCTALSRDGGARGRRPAYRVARRPARPGALVRGGRPGRTAEPLRAVRQRAPRSARVGSPRGCQRQGRGSGGDHRRRLRLLPRSAEAIRRLNGAGVAAVVVTNQAGLARGYFSEEILAAVNAALVSQLKDDGAHLDGVYVCTHHPTEGAPPYRMACDCRKPKPGLLLRAAAELGLDLARATLVGDKGSDLEAARAVGARAVLVLTGYGLGEW